MTTQKSAPTPGAMTLTEVKEVRACPHKILRKQMSGTVTWYVCECGQKFKVQEWDGRVRITK